MVKDTKPPEPEFLKQWREWVQKGPPRCCHTCDFFGMDGECKKFNAKPDIEFLNTQDACEYWQQDIPF